MEPVGPSSVVLVEGLVAEALVAGAFAAVDALAAADADALVVVDASEVDQSSSAADSGLVGRLPLLFDTEKTLQLV